jgi:hypothetical protein
MFIFFLLCIECTSLSARFGADNKSFSISSNATGQTVKIQSKVEEGITLSFTVSPESSFTNLLPAFSLEIDAVYEVGPVTYKHVSFYDLGLVSYQPIFASCSDNVCVATLKTTDEVLSFVFQVTELSDPQTGLFTVVQDLQMHFNWFNNSRFQRLSF